MTDFNYHQAFLSRYVEDNMSARLLAEDDNPPSPMSPMPPGRIINYVGKNNRDQCKEHLNLYLKSVLLAD